MREISELAFFNAMWIQDIYFYKKGTLKAIAEGYECLYSDAPLAELFSVAEYKADFDRALSSIGRGKWEGLVSSDFGNYRHFGKQQRVIIADILGITDYKLKGLGFYEIPQLRGQAYSRMMDSLNNYGVAEFNRME